MLSNLITLIFHVPIVYYFAVYLDLGIKGIAYATTINFFLKYFAVILFIRFTRYYENVVSLLAKESF